MKKNNIVLLLTCVVLSELLGVLTTSLSFSSLDTWYAQLKKSSFSLPGHTLLYVWFFLFALLGVSLYLVVVKNYKLRAGQKDYFRPAMAAFILKWLVGFAWSFTFFYLRDPLLSLYVLILLEFTFVLMGYYFYHLRPLAAYLLIPNFIWLLFIIYLDFTILQLN